jgi:hypothetical protein
MALLEQRMRNKLEGKELEIYGPDNTEFFLSASSQNYDRVCILLQKALANGKHIDVDERSPTGYTPLMLAAKQGNIRMMRLLLDHGADKDARNKYGDSAIHWAADEHKYEAVELLIQNGANLSFENERGRTPLHWVLDGIGNFDSKRIDTAKMIALLVRGGADVNAGDGVRMTPFVLLAFRLKWLELGEEGPIRPPHFDLLELMMKHGANVNATSDSPYTALHLAALHGNMTLMFWLISVNADWNIENECGKTVFQTLALPETDISSMAHIRRKNHILYGFFLELLQEIKDTVERMPFELALLMSKARRGRYSPFHGLPLALIHKIQGHGPEGPSPQDQFIWNLAIARLDPYHRWAAMDK